MENKIIINQKNPQGLQVLILLASLLLAFSLFFWIFVSVRYAPLRANETNLILFFLVSVFSFPTLLYFRHKIPKTSLGVRLQRPSVWFVATPLVNFGIIGLILFLNGFLDHAALKSKEMLVTQKSFSWGLKTHYPQLHYVPFTKKTLPFSLDEDEKVPVLLTDFEQAQVGTTKVKILWKDGFLNIPWKINSSMVY